MTPATDAPQPPERPEVARPAPHGPFDDRAWHGASPRYLTVVRLGEAGWLLIALVLTAVGLHFALDPLGVLGPRGAGHHGDDAAGGQGGSDAAAGYAAPWFAWPLVIVGAALALYCLAVLLWLAARRARAIGYQLRDDDLVVRRGVMVRRTVAVPYGRMQLVDTSQGPIMRRFDLATLTLRTASAGTDASIPGLPSDEALRVRDELARRAERRRAGL